MPIYACRTRRGYIKESLWTGGVWFSDWINDGKYDWRNGCMAESAAERLSKCFFDLALHWDRPSPLPQYLFLKLHFIISPHLSPELPHLIICPPFFFFGFPLVWAVALSQTIFLPEAWHSLAHWNFHSLSHWHSKQSATPLGLEWGGK